jgi:hypothetical protein
MPAIIPCCRHNADTPTYVRLAEKQRSRPAAKNATVVHIKKAAPVSRLPESRLDNEEPPLGSRHLRAAGRPPVPTIAQKVGLSFAFPPHRTPTAYRSIALDRPSIALLSVRSAHQYWTLVQLFVTAEFFTVFNPTPRRSRAEVHLRCHSHTLNS